MPEKAKKIILTPEQDSAIFNPAFETLYGGQAGGGKSAGLTFVPIIDIRPGYNAILFRRTFPQLEGADGLIDLGREFYTTIPGAKYSESRYRWRLPGGASIKYAHMSNKNSHNDYHGHQYSMVGFDELQQFLYAQYVFMFSRIRKAAEAGFRTRIFSTANPGAKWVFHRWRPWLDPRYPNRAKPGEVRYFRRKGREGEIEVFGKERFLKNVWTRTFIPASYRDNPYINRDEYERNLDMLSYVDRMRYKYGDWLIDIGKGLVINRDWFIERIVEDFPPRMRKIRFWDLAATEVDPDSNNDPDFTATGKMATDGTRYFIELRRRQANWPNIKKWMLRVAENEPDVHVYWEQEPGSSGKALSYEIATALRKIGRSGTGLPARKNKLTRAKLWTPIAEQGFLYVVEHPDTLTEDILGEYHVFIGDGGGHDDLVDATSGCFENCPKPTASGGWSAGTLKA